MAPKSLMIGCPACERTLLRITSQTAGKVGVEGSVCDLRKRQPTRARPLCPWCRARSRICIWVDKDRSTGRGAQCTGGDGTRFRLHLVQGNRMQSRCLYLRKGCPGVGMRYQVEYSGPGADCYETYERYFHERARLAEKSPTMGGVWGSCGREGWIG